MEPEVNLNNPRLQAILGKSKAVMQEAERKFPDKKTKNNQTGNYSEPAPQEYLEREPPMPTMPSRNLNEGHIDTNSSEYKARVEASKMPDAIKKMMLNSPLNESPVPNEPMLRESQVSNNQPIAKQPQPTTPAAPKQMVSEGTINRDEIKGIIKEVLAEMMVKTISESSIKRTLKTLINEGKIKPKK